MDERVGVYICHCGTNIAGMVDVFEVARWAGDQPQVKAAREHKFLCSRPGLQQIVEDIEKLGLTRVVVAACSPFLHENTFRKALVQAGLNPYLLEIANIRELNSWTTEDPEAATRKAKAQVNGAIQRVLHHKPLEPIQVKINPHTLIVGGGIAGITAALELANGGYPVTLVERLPSIGGHMAQWDKTFPVLDCAACILTPRMVDVEQHPNITLLTCSEVEAVEGALGNFTVTVRKKRRYINEALCTGCAICEEECPKTVLDTSFEAGLGVRKAIYRPFPGAVPNYPLIDAQNCTYFKNGKCKACEIYCPAEAIDFNQEDEIRKLEVGNVILTTGFDTFDPHRVPQLGYGQLDNVFTSVEFERMVSASGPTAGRILMRSPRAEPKSIAILHCVGSRDKNYNEYCSRVCCMSSLKFAHLARERIPGVEVYNIYTDIRASGKHYEEFYQKVMDEGTHFIRGQVSAVSNDGQTLEEDDKLIVQVYDTLQGGDRRIPVDMVILSVGLEPCANARQLSKMFGLACDSYNFYTERDPRLDPVMTVVEGVFVAGACQGPMAIPEAVSQASAAAARVICQISKGSVMLDPIKAAIETERCSGCRICSDACSYNAILFHPDQKVPQVVSALCQGCGACAAACPSAAISIPGYTQEQLSAQVEGLLWDVRQPV